MKTLQQLDLFDLDESEIIEVEPALQITKKLAERAVPINDVEIPELHDEVKIKLPEDKESETYQYLKYYYSHLTNKIGKVIDVRLYPSGKYTCEVEFGNEVLLLHPENLIIRY